MGEGPDLRDRVLVIWDPGSRVEDLAGLGQDLDVRVVEDGQDLLVVGPDLDRYLERLDPVAWVRASRERG